MPDMTEITSEWAQRHMPRTRRAIESLPGMAGVRLAMSMHLDMKMVPLVEGLVRRGAALFVTTCNPATVRDDVVEAMRACGARVEAWKDMADNDWRAAVAAGLGLGADPSERDGCGLYPFPADA